MGTITPSPSIEALLYHAQKEGILPITSRCNMGCIFCSNAYNPPGCEIFNIPPRSPEEIEDTILWLGASRGPVVIGESVTRINEGEPLTHPEFAEILKLVRKYYPHKPIKVTTNCSLLDRELIALLSDLEVELLVSLNTVGHRERVMRDPEPERTLKNVSALGGKVSFEGSIVALPFITGWEDIRETGRFLKESGAKLIRLLSPGFSSRHPLASYLIPGIWTQIREFSKELARELKIPILSEPPEIRDLSARVEEVLPGSPAKRAHLRSGDVILRVAGLEVFSRKEAFELARDRENPKISYERDGVLYDTTLTKEKYESPGFIMYEDLDPEEWFSWERKSGIRRGRNVLILTSSLAKPVIEKALEARGLSARVEEVPSLFFGGNIQAGGLLTVRDFVERYREVTSDGFRPEVVTLPARAFDPWGRDLRGEHYKAFMEETGCPVIISG